MTQGSGIGFAILGTGIIAEQHSRAIAANSDWGARLVAVGHYDPSRFGEIGARFGVPCQSESNLLANPAVDALCICTPSGQHAAQAIAAARAGKHVLVEKPMALSLADADAMIAAADESGVRLGVALQRRVDPTFRRVYDAIQAGDLGALTLGMVSMPYFRSQGYFDQAAWRGTWSMDGGGVLMNQGIHIVDLLVWYMGDPVQVLARADTLHRDVKVEDTLAAVLRFANGSLATITATTTAAPGFPHRIEIYGTGGAIQLEGESARRWDLVEPTAAKVERPSLASQPPAAGAGGSPRGIALGGHTALVRDFVEAIQTNRAPQVEGHEGRRSLATVLAVYEAAGLLKAVR